MPSFPFASSFFTNATGSTAALVLRR
jgi:hypothetical protein